MTLFPFADYWWFYGLFLIFVLIMLALDLGIFNRKAHIVSFKEATVWSIIWVVLALTFNFLFYRYSLGKFGAETAQRLALEFLSGYIVEYSLSIDNIFVFVLVFGYFAIPPIYKHRVLFYGILGALIFRAIFIALGSALMQFHWVIYIFGVFLIFTGIKMMFSKETEIEPEKNILVKIFTRFMPVTNTISGKDFFVKNSGVTYATPLFIALLFLEATDVIFAIDSVPAIFALTKEPLIVFTSNIFAILGLRALYFALANIVEIFIYLKYGVAVILFYVGIKMIISKWHIIPTEFSLIFIVLCLAISMYVSLKFKNKPKFKNEIEKEIENKN